MFEEVIFDEHIHAYLIEEVNRNKCINYKKLPVVAPVMSVEKNNNHYVVTKYML